MFFADLPSGDSHRQRHLPGLINEEIVQLPFHLNHAVPPTNITICECVQ